MRFQMSAYSITLSVGAQGWDLSLPEVEGTKPPGSNVTPFGISSTARCMRPTHRHRGRQDRTHPQREMLCELTVTPATLPDSARLGEEAFTCSGIQAG